MQKNKFLEHNLRNNTFFNKQIIWFVLLMCNAFYAQEYSLKSPDEKIQANINVSDSLTFSIQLDNKTLLLASPIGLEVNDKILGINEKVKNIKRTNIDRVVERIFPTKTNKIEEKCNALKIEFKKNFGVEFRVYNQGVAYRFYTTIKDSIYVNNETVLFNFPKDYSTLYPEEELQSFLSHNEPYYKDYKLTQTKDKLCFLPMLVKADNNVKLFFSESDLVDYAGMWFKGTGKQQLKAIFPKYPLEGKITPDVGCNGLMDRSYTITRRADYIAKTKGSRTFPWRIIGVSENDKELFMNQLTYLLSPPSKIEDYSWIKPGKVAWDWYNANNITGVPFTAGVNTDTYKYYIDFASENNLEYVILDEGWSNREGSGDLFKFEPDMDVKEILRYAKTKEVGIILWCTSVTLEKQYEKALDSFAAWGVKGIKMDFKQHSNQKAVQFYEKIAKDAADRKMLIDTHGSYKPAGLGRMYPNYITREAAHGNEFNKWSAEQTPDHNLNLPFIRMVSGPIDYTPGAMRNAQKNNYKIIFDRPMSQGTRCHQLAMYAIYESPLQMLCDAPSLYKKEKESLDLIKQFPTIWEQTIVFDAKVGNYLSLARKNGDNWYLGAMTDWTSRKMRIPLDFLDEDQVYEIQLFVDGPNAERNAEDYLRKVYKVSSKDSLSFDVAPGGGMAAVIKKIK